MAANIVNQVAFLRTSRNFPQEIDELALELSKSYLDTAMAVNDRTIGIFPANKPAITGESWFPTNRKQQSFRRIFTFTTTANIAHNLTFNQLDYISLGRGQFTDGTNWYGLIFGSNVAIAGQISFYLDPTNIVFSVGAGAPALTKGIIILEWLSFS